MASDDDLSKLKAEIDALAGRIEELKASGGDKDAIGSAVASLLAAKQNYADQNNGIGVDGQPYRPPMSKKEKKAQEKAAAAAANSNEGPSTTQVSGILDGS